MPTPAISGKLAAQLKQPEIIAERGALICTTGREGMGKTGFAMSAALCGNTVYIPMDRDPVGSYVDQWQQSGQLYVPKEIYKKLGGNNKNKGFDASAAPALWDSLVGLTRDVFSDKGVRTIIWDTATFAWELLRMARFGKLTQVMPHMYAPCNAEYENLIWEAESARKFFVLIHTMKKEYVGGKNSKGDGQLEGTWNGKYERAGYSRMGFVANVLLEHFRTEDNGFGVRVLQNKVKPEMDGVELIGDDCNFSTLAYKTFGGEMAPWFGLESE